MHPDATIITIYTNNSDIENKIDTAIYNATINEVSHQSLESETQFNIYTTELIALYLTIK